MPIKLVDLVWQGWHQYASVVAVLVLVVWAVVTRMLHWDGLADTADGWFGRTEIERQQMASDTHIGAFGVTAIVLVALAEFAALSTILTAHEHQLLLIPPFARFAATFAAWLGRPAKADGLGAAVVGRPSAAGVLSAGLGAAILSGLLVGIHWHLHGVVMLVVFWLLAAGVPHLLSKRFGGVTGDVMGASILITEAAMFVIIAVVG